MQWFNRILFAAETAVEQGAALERAVALTVNNQAQLTVIDVVPDVASHIDISYGGEQVQNLQEALLAERCSALESMIEPYRDKVEIRLEVLVGKRSLELIRAVLRDDHDLLIKPAENPGYTQRLFGSDDMQLLRNCPCPVWLTRAGEAASYRTVLAAVDLELDSPDNSGAGLSEYIAEISSSIAVADFAALHFIHAWEAPGEGLIKTWTSPEESSAYVDEMRSIHEDAFSGLRDQLRAKMGNEGYEHLDPQFHLRRGMATTAIAAAVDEVEAGLLVMGTVARTGIAGWIVGNTAEAVLEQVQCSVLAVKPRGFVSPVGPGA